LMCAPTLASSERSARGGSVRVHPRPNTIVVGPHSAILAPNHDLNDVTGAARGAAPRKKSGRKLPPGRADSALPVRSSGGGVGARRDPRTTNCTAIIGNDCKELYSAVNVCKSSTTVGFSSSKTFYNTAPSKRVAGSVMGLATRRLAVVACSRANRFGPRASRAPRTRVETDARVG